MLQAGTGEESTIALHTNQATNTGAYRGIQRLVILNNGRVEIKKEPTYLGITSFNPEAGSLHIRGNASVGSAEPANSSGSDRDTDTGKFYATTEIKSPLISASNLEFSYSSASYTVGTNGWGVRTVTNTAGTPTGGNNGDIYLVYS